MVFNLRIFATLAAEKYFSLRLSASAVNTFTPTQNPDRVCELFQ
jgi:hypothetical protein